MDLLYPRPKCKFGSNDRVVEATYVKCTEKPISMDDLEGRNRAKVSLFLLILTRLYSIIGVFNAITVLKLAKPCRCHLQSHLREISQTLSIVNLSVTTCPPS